MGKSRKKSMSKKGSISKKGSMFKKKGSKRPLNAYFKKMLEAKKSNSPSFMYNGKKYVGNAHSRLGMIYKKEN